jgi:hypothetical protein
MPVHQCKASVPAPQQAAEGGSYWPAAKCWSRQWKAEAHLHLRLLGITTLL